MSANDASRATDKDGRLLARRRIGLQQAPSSRCIGAPSSLNMTSRVTLLGRFASPVRPCAHSVISPASDILLWG